MGVNQAGSLPIHGMAYWTRPYIKNTSTGQADGCHLTGIALCSSRTRRTCKYDVSCAKTLSTGYFQFTITYRPLWILSKTILVDKNMVYVDGEKITQTMKTEDGERVIVLNKQAVLDLQMLRKQFDEQTEIIAGFPSAIRFPIGMRLLCAGSDTPTTLTARSSRI